MKKGGRNLPIFSVPKYPAGVGGCETPAPMPQASITIGFSSASITAFRNSAPKAPSITR